MREAMISIIVPVYNAENYLNECINSILNQTYEKIELILIDDGSTDSSVDILHLWEKRDERIKVLFQKNGGPNVARKNGLEHAQGEYVMFVDADDYVDKTICEHLYTRCKSNNAQMTYCKTMKVFDSNNMTEVSIVAPGTYRGSDLAENYVDVYSDYAINISMGLCATLYERQLISKVLLSVDFRIKFAEDYACLILALLDAERVCVSDEALYFYRQNWNSLTHVQDKGCYLSQKYLYNFLKKEFAKRNVNKVLYRQLEWIIMKNLLMWDYTIFSNANVLFPFENVEKGDRIIVYGAGAFGRALVAYIGKSRVCEVILWVDRKYKDYRKLGLSVDAIETINECQYKYILIGVINTRLTEEIKKTLLEMSIEEERIKWVNQEMLTYKYLPEELEENRDA